MIVRFTQEERDYIVNNKETDLLLTELGLKLVEGFKEVEKGVYIEVSDKDYKAFVEDFKDEYIWKSKRINNLFFFKLAKRFITNLESLKAIDFSRE